MPLYRLSRLKKPCLDAEAWTIVRHIQDNGHDAVSLQPRSGTDQMLFDVPTMISFISQVVTLYPGDVIFTGTCDGVGPMDDGDTVEVEISNIGVLRNPVRRETE